MDSGISVKALLCTSILAQLSLGYSTPRAIGSSKRGDTPQAVVIPPSEHFEGNDGPWSTCKTQSHSVFSGLVLEDISILYLLATFSQQSPEGLLTVRLIFNIEVDLRVGTTEQDIRVLVSTASPESFIVLLDYGCSTSVFETVPPNCAISRGNLFNPNQSTSWHAIGDYGINQNGVGLEANLGYSQRTTVGIDHLGLGLTGPSLDNQIIAGIATPEPFYLGLFGLNTQPVNFSAVGNSTTPAFLTTLKDNGATPSLSWSYTAGAKYRLKQVYGQLILSGYDASRFVANTVSFSMAGDVTRDLVVVLQSISYSGSTSTTLLSDPIDIFIDSTDPNLWLPSDVCDAFESAFGLVLDDKSGLYLVNETQHNTLLNSDAEVTFRISDVSSGGDTVRITLPYAAFDLTAQYPLVDNQSYYFPLKRAANSTQYTLGRTFLQEAYLTADYERLVFNVSACQWVAGAEENIITIPSKESGSGSGSNSGKGSSLNGGAIAGIVVGAVVAALLIIAAIIFFIRRQRKKRAYAAQDPVTDMAVITGPVHNHRSQRSGKYFSPETVGTSTDAANSEDNRGTNGSSNIGDSVAGGSSQQELDGEDTQIEQVGATDAHGVPVAASSPGETKLPERQQSPVYYELAGKEVSRPESKTASGSSGVVPHTAKEPGDDHLDSPLVSTLSSSGWPDKRADASSALVSPTTPVRHTFGQT
ncbi:acid protease [Nemania sp. FL0916]|nr:acid protease [Nemania sp. FL0916]